MNSDPPVIAILQAAGLMVAALATWTWLLVARPRLDVNSLATDRLRWGPLHVLLVAATFLVLPAIIVSAQLGEQPLNELPLPQQARVFLLAESAVCLFAIAALMGFLGSGLADRNAVGLRPGSAPAALGAGTLGFTCLAVPAYVLQLLVSQWDPRDHPILDQLRENPDIVYFQLMTISVVILAPLAEEIVFRVVLLGWLTTSLPQTQNPEQLAEADSSQPQSPHWLAIVVSSGIFAIIHLPAGLGAVCGLFVFSLGLGYVYQRTGSLLSCVLMHMLLNGFTMLNMYLLHFHT